MAETVSGGVVQDAAEQESLRQQKMAQAWAVYYGDDPLPLPVASDDTDDNVRLNYGRLIVNKGVSWLFGADRGLKFSVPDNDSAEQELEDLWPTEQRAVALHQMGVNGAVTGHNFVRLMPGPEGQPPRVIVLDPSNMTVIWDQEDIDRVVEYRYQWNAIDSDGKPYVRRQRHMRNLSEPDLTGEQTDLGNWQIIDEQSTEDANAWTVLAEETWDYDWPQIFDNQNLPAPNEFYGASDLENDVLDLIVALEVVGGYCRKLVRHRGHPLPYVIGETTERLEQLNMALGRVLVIPEVGAQVGQLQSADLGAALELYDRLKQALYEISRVPATAFGTSMSNIAEETVELSFAPAVEKTWDKRITYGPMLTNLTGRMLELAQKNDLRPMPQWTPVVPRSAKSEAEALERDLRMGVVSKKTAANKRGYDWDTEAPQIAEERAVAMSQVGTAFNSGDINVSQ